MTALVNGVTYQCTVTAKNVAGTGLPSAPLAVTPQPAPTAPTGVGAVAGVGRPTVTFTAPVGSFSAVTGYLVTCTSAVVGAATPVTASSASTSIVVTGLTTGDLYSCSVQAINAYGSSAASAASQVTPL